MSVEVLVGVRAFRERSLRARRAVSVTDSTPLILTTSGSKQKNKQTLKHAKPNHSKNQAFNSFGTDQGVKAFRDQI